MSANKETTTAWDNSQYVLVPYQGIISIGEKLTEFGKPHTCMSVLRTYLQDLDDAPIRLKSKVLATCSRSRIWAVWSIYRQQRMSHKKNDKYCALFAKQETSLSASLTMSSMALPSGSLVATANKWHTTFIPSTDCNKGKAWLHQWINDSYSPSSLMIIHKSRIIRTQTTNQTNKQTDRDA